MTSLPLLSSLVLVERYPILVFSLFLLLAVNCLRLIHRYAIRGGCHGIKYLSLHKDTVLITYHNRQTQSAKVIAITAIRGWVLIELAGSSGKIIVDKTSVGVKIFSRILRQLKTFNANERVKPSALTDQLR